MKEYFVTLPIEGKVTYRVKATNEREAIESCIDSDDCEDYIEILWGFADTEYNPIEVEDV